MFERIGGRTAEYYHFAERAPVGLQTRLKTLEIEAQARYANNALLLSVLGLYHFEQ
jgi:hypothetical protein